MKNEVQANRDEKIPFEQIIPELNKFIAETENKISSNLKSINLTGDQFVITDQLPGVFCEGVQYYDLQSVGYINNTGMANLIELLKSLLGKGVEVQFVNVNDRIKEKIKAMGLDHILNCE